MSIKNDVDDISTKVRRIFVEQSQGIGRMVVDLLTIFYEIQQHFEIRRNVYDHSTKCRRNVYDMSLNTSRHVVGIP